MTAVIQMNSAQTVGHLTVQCNPDASYATCNWSCSTAVTDRSDETDITGPHGRDKKCVQNFGRKT